MRTWMAAAGVAMGMVLGCVGPNGVNSTGGGASGQGGSGSGAGAGTGGSTTTIGGDSGLPCDVASLLSTHCTSCHGNPPSSNAPMSLLTYAELTAPSKGDPAKSNAQLSVDRMKSTSAPMPPGINLPATDIAVLENWVTAGTPMGNCGMVDAGPPDPAFQGDPTCASGNTATHISEGAADGLPDSALAAMNPGEKCLACHGGEPNFAIAGTVFDTGKVTDRCLPPATVDLTQAQVIITDKNGVDHTLTVNHVGNFHTQNNLPIAKPYTAKVVYQGKTRAMSAAQTSGECNNCHSAGGSQGAPGRIALPQ